VPGGGKEPRPNGEYSQAFHITRGLKQGDALSPVLFNLALENAIRTASVKAEIFGPGGPKLILAYADYIGAVEESTVSVKENFIKIEEEAQRWEAMMSLPKYIKALISFRRSSPVG